VKLQPIRADSKDRTFWLEFTSDIPGTMTSMEKKDNSSSVYMKSVYMNTSYTAHVVGGYAGFDSEAEDCSMGRYYRFNYLDCARFMYNDVNERGFSDAAVSAFGSPGAVSGYWSPDSVPQAGVLPPTDYIK
ncbi:MAG: hypothetical protein NC086_10810, partial [Alistipes sp.]|nr:hypothetical protein [Alistipes sp.]